MASDAGAAQDRPVPRVVICGGGIIGASTAYYLARKGLGAGVTVVEREEPACAASGKAGGFLALDWNDSSPVGPLARLSYALHAQLAKDLGTDVGYRGVTTLQVAGQEAAPAGRAAGAAARVRDSGRLPAWLDGNVTAVTDMGGPDTTAQVHPALLTRALLAAAVARGATLLTSACAEGLQLEAAAEGAAAVAAVAAAAGRRHGGGGLRVTGVRVAGRDPLPADYALIAMGPWSDAARAWLADAVAAAAAAASAASGAAAGAAPQLPRVTGQKYHSVVLRPAAPVSGHMLFTGFKLASGRSVEPEVYPRPDGTVYVCGEPQTTPVPPSPAQVTVEAGLCDNLRTVAGSLASCLAEAPVEARQACYLPCAEDGLPVIGGVPGVAGLLVGTGHTCWGILNGPATGLALAELVAEGRARSVDVGAFSPARFGPAAAAAAARRR